MPGIAEHHRVRRSYDTVAETYRERIGDELDGKPLDRALLAALVEEAGPEPVVVDLGCGPGHVAAWLAGQGVRAVGVDLSPAMVATGRAAYPGVEFREGDLLGLPAADGEFDAAVALYSVIHLAADELRPAFAEMRRVLRPDGTLLVAFHVGTETRHLDDWWGHPVDVDFHFFPVELVADALRDVGLVVRARLERSPLPQEASTERCYLLARRPA
ncbi:class I SAM-dependent methyltransferase [Micromonospora mirobrigensis]|uniref:Methyltransferase domain-containing protein n=1 Tax=Micromonospora mirobrigensis TaxID=262898 RepID=A0A1C4XY69_9ACTN|nr:class I SAM-dependent methyltransferase [Micromonospora mirobrigensis]SCF13417.1 Methyltransferase domain-containing protein [Micromonospora mirobrigensis]